MRLRISLTGSIDLHRVVAEHPQRDDQPGLRVLHVVDAAAEGLAGVLAGADEVQLGAVGVAVGRPVDDDAEEQGSRRRRSCAGPGRGCRATWPLLMNTAISSASTIARVTLADVDVGPLVDDLVLPVVRHRDELAVRAGPRDSSRSCEPMIAGLRSPIRTGRPGVCPQVLGSVLPGRLGAIEGGHGSDRVPVVPGAERARAPRAARSAARRSTSRNVVSDSGWREAPRLRDMTEFQFSQQHLPGRGRDRAGGRDEPRPQGDAVYFEHHVLLWKDEHDPAVGDEHRRRHEAQLGGMPFVVTVAHGPGRVAFSRDAPGELVVLPLHPGMELDVREHAFLVASHTHPVLVRADQGPGQPPARRQRHVHGPLRHRRATRACCCCTATATCFERTLRPGEKILVEPGGFLYKDSTVQMKAVQLPLKTGLFAARACTWPR